MTQHVNIPPASQLVFENGITHPDLWLWDSWLLTDHGELHLYCLALNRMSDDNAPIMPADRNNYAFHVRRFVSSDGGGSWRDKGAILSSGMLADGSDARNIWSGSATCLSTSSYLFAHTGVHQPTSARPFVQTINASLTDDLNIAISQPEEALICPVRDYEMIRQAGYYLAPLNELGHAEGEEGGPIMAWRDPFTLVDENGAIHLFASAKTGPKTPAILHARLSVRNGVVVLKELLPPIGLPDADEYTQAEVPKVYHDERHGLYYLLISSCDRLYEGQIDSEVAKQHRLYKSSSLEGPWMAYREAGSRLPDMDKLFGASLVEANFETGQLTFIAPYTEMAPITKQLTFAPIFIVNIHEHPKELNEKRA